MQYVGAAAGIDHTVLIRNDGDALAFGSNDFGQCDVPELPLGLQYVDAAVAYRHTVLVRSDGEALAFGLKGRGQCDVPELPLGMQYVVAAARDSHTVLIRSGGDALAFGTNDYGRCDVPETTQNNLMLLVLRHARNEGPCKGQCGDHNCMHSFRNQAEAS